MKVLVAGIDSTNYNYRKIKGFVDAFSKKFETKHISGDSLPVRKELQENQYDILFGEITDLSSIDASKIKNCIIWCNIGINNFINFASSNPETKFILAPKSLMHVNEITEHYISLFGNQYQISGNEGQDLTHLKNILQTSTRINDHSFKILNNLVYTFLPCSLSQKIDPLDAEYDVCYFGTPLNRPKVQAVLKALGDKGYRLKTSMIDGFIHPEECVNLYRKTVCNITQQVHPVMLEHPVRLGESTAGGCLTFVIDSLIPHNYNDELVPKYEIAQSIEQIEHYIQTHRSLESRKLIASSFTSTYDNAVNRILEMLALM